MNITAILSNWTHAGSTERDSVYARMHDDPVLLCRVLYVLCRKQREQQQVSEEEFYVGVIGDAIDDATDAMLKAIVSFTPRRSRELLEVSVLKTDRLRQMATERALKKINDPALEAKLLDLIDQKMDEALGSLTPRPSASG